MNRPDYARDDVFETLLGLCRDAGLDVRFVALPPSIYARSRARILQMPEDNRFFSQEHACVVLGHELAHFLVNPNFPEIESDEPLTLARSMLLESECDRVGTYLFALAQAMAENARRQAGVTADGQEKAPAGEPQETDPENLDTR